MGNQKSSLPYSINDENIEYDGFTRTGWKLFDGIKKSDGTKVSILKFEKKEVVKFFND